MYKSNYDVQRISRRATRGAERFDVEQYNVVKYKNSPSYKGSELWDELSRDVTESTCLTEVKRYLMKEYRIY